MKNLLSSIYSFYIFLKHSKKKRHFKEQQTLLCVCVPEHVEKAIPRLGHAVIVHLQWNQVSILIGNFKRWEGRSVCESQQSENTW